MRVCICCKKMKHSEKFIIETKLIDTIVSLNICDDCGTQERFDTDENWREGLIDDGVLSHSNCGPVQFSNIYKRYGIDENIYNNMYVEQNGRCKICNRHQSRFSKRLSLDHNHKTGKVRGLLCQACNTSLGLMQENEQSLLKMLLYIKQNN